ncbi:MAG: dicarboxylate/amino acid:cation symporter [Faecalicoccus sp.]|uniref:dicarboxylate/amino acid:cation symporter n=1 Tax=Faecalicoccus sp. TaxID=1971758 RepID=UPI002A83A99E|nr:dicarboxylate/amino acid:cation symporter [Faecalicoccus sp.]MCI6378857.1 dicarboxylate/amino acid:cation symporter [Erysipelotrichaceae bacterium]MDY4869732.1 dicarboxylate/amino acid:cation symporter [Faecalicoccus sp.]
MKESKFWKQYGSVLLLLGGILIGSLIGIVSSDFGKVLKPIGDIFLNLLFTIVVPLVFVSITTAVGSMSNLKRLGKILGSTLLTFIGTGIFAAVCVLVWVNVFSPASGTSIAVTNNTVQEAQSLSDLIVSTLTVSDFYMLLDKSHMLPLIIFAILFGLCVSMSGGDESPVGKLLKNLNEIIMRFVGIIMKLAPIGLGAYFANLIAEYGPQLLGDYGRSMIVYYPLCLLYAFIFFPLYAYFSGGTCAVKRMFKHIFTPAITAFATQSSAATLPVNKEACEKIGVPSDISDIVLPMGCTMHMDGSVLSSITKIVFLFATFNLPFTGIDTYAMSILVAICSAFVLSGAPGGGLVGEVLIVSMFGFPPEAFPLIATLGFLFDPMATALNASGDTIASMIVTRLVEGKNWLIQHSTNGSK